MPIDLNFIVQKNPVAFFTQKLINCNFIKNFVEYFSKTLIKNPPIQVQKMLFGIGMASLTFSLTKTCWHILNKIGWIPMHFLHRRNINSEYFQKKYGKCYVLITGCTDGIGLQFAKQFSLLGFNLYLIARNSKKLDKVITELKAINPRCEIKYCITDLGHEQEIEEMEKNIESLDSDIGIVVNCAGISSHGYFMELDPYDFLTMTNVNFYSMYTINRKLIPKLRTRKQKSAIINVSSCVGRFNTFYLGVYPSLKRMADIYSRTLSAENKDKIDIISCCPFGVTTKMLNYKKGPIIISAEDCVRSTLGDLGKSDLSYTGLKHKIAATYFERIEEENQQKIYGKIWKKILKE